MIDGLIKGEASYLFADGDREEHKQLSSLVKSIASAMGECFGSFLVVEVWAEDDGWELSEYRPAFRIYRPRKTAISSTIETMARALGEIKIRKKRADVTTGIAKRIAPPELPQLISPSEAKHLGCHLLGIGVRPVYMDEETGDRYPLIRRRLHHGFSRALKNSFFEFTHSHTTNRPAHYQALGRRSMVKAVWEVDRQLAELGDSFDFLLQVTPTNTHATWLTFKRKLFEYAPRFAYRPLPVDPIIAKRKLFRIPVERIEDPTLAQLFREKQLELDRTLTMLIDRESPRFALGSQQLYGGVKESLFELARQLLNQLSPRSRDDSHGESIDARAFAARAEEELEYFRRYLPESSSSVMLRDDITGLMVSQGNLLIGTRTKIPVTRVRALIEHEVGTHVLTYLNGKAQPFRQLYVGLPGYDELQEGLAVLSEYMVGGLTSPRMRLLAARVVATSQMIDGASFVEVFRELNKTYGFERHSAYNIAVRIFRCGGLTKDAVYLQGLVRLLEYMKNGGALEELLVGKISARHLSIVQELQWRKVLRPAPLLPRYLEEPETVFRLSELRKGLSPIDLIHRRKK